MLRDGLSVAIQIFFFKRLPSPLHDKERWPAIFNMQTGKEKSQKSPHAL